MAGRDWRLSRSPLDRCLRTPTKPRYDTLWSMIQGDPNIFSVDLSRDANTNDLRKAIEGERKLDLSRGIGLETWKVLQSISAGCGMLPYIFVAG